MSGGVTRAVERVLDERSDLQEGGEAVEITALACNGADECRKALMLLKAGRLKEDFVEGMFCTGGCMGGPANLNELQKSKKVFDTRLDGADNISQNVRDKGCAAADVHRR